MNVLEKISIVTLILFIIPTTLALNMSLIGSMLYWNGTELVPVNSTIVPSKNPNFDYEVTRGHYQAYFKSDLSSLQVVEVAINKTTFSFQPMGLNYRNGLGMIQQISIPQSVKGVADGNVFIYPNAYGKGINLTYTYKPLLLKENLVVASKKDLPDPATYLGNNVTLDLDFIILSSSNRFKIDNSFIDIKKMAKSYRIKRGIIVLDKSGNTIYKLPKPIAHDSNGTEVNCTYEFKKFGGNVYVILKVPYDFIQKAVYPIYIDPSVSFDSEYVFNAETTDCISITSLDSTHFAIAYEDYGNSYRGMVRVGHFTGSSIVWDTSGTVFNSEDSRYISITSLNSTHFVIAYQDGGHSDYGTAIVGHFTGSSIVWDTSETIFNSGDTYLTSMTSLDSTHFVIAYQDSDHSDYGTAIVGHFTGSSIVWDTSETIFNSGDTQYISITSLNSTHFAIVYQDYSNSKYGTAIVGHFNGTNIIWDTSESVFNPGTTFHISITSLDSTHFTIAYSDGGNSQYGTAIVGHFNGTNIIWDTSESVFNSGITQYISITSLNSTHFAIAYRDYSNSKYGTAIVGHFTGSSIVWDTPERVFNSGTTDCISITSLNSTHFVIAYQDGGNSFHGTATVGHLVPNTAPIVSSTSKPTDPSAYSSNASYTFNAVLCDDDGFSDISAVTFVFGGTDYTPTLDSSDANCGYYHYTISDLDVGTYNWQWTVIDSAGESDSANGTFTVSKAPPTINNITYTITGLGDDEIDVVAHVNVTDPEGLSDRSACWFNGNYDWSYENGSMSFINNTLNQDSDMVTLVFPHSESPYSVYNGTIYCNDTGGLKDEVPFNFIINDDGFDQDKSMTNQTLDVQYVSDVVHLTNNGSQPFNYDLSLDSNLIPNAILETGEHFTGSVNPGQTKDLYTRYRGDWLQQAYVNFTQSNLYPTEMDWWAFINATLEVNNTVADNYNFSAFIEFDNISISSYSRSGWDIESNSSIDIPCISSPPTPLYYHILMSKRGVIVGKIEGYNFTTVEVGEPANGIAYLSVNNTDYNVSYNAFVNKTQVQLLLPYNYTTNVESFYTNLTPREKKIFPINVTITVPTITEKNMTVDDCPGMIIYPTYCIAEKEDQLSSGATLHQYTVKTILNVTDANIKEANIIYKELLSRFPNFLIRDSGSTQLWVDKVDTNVSLSNDDNHVIITIGNHHSNSSLEPGLHEVDVTYTYTTEVSTSPTGGGGGGGAPPTAVCGNGICEYGENSDNCPSDCSNVTFSLLPTYTEKFADAGKTLVQEYVLKNTNPTSIHVHVSISKANDDSYRWAKLKIGDATFSQYDIDVPGGNNDYPGKATFTVMVNVPTNNINEKKYTFNVIAESGSSRVSSPFTLVFSSSITNPINALSGLNKFINTPLIELPKPVAGVKTITVKLIAITGILSYLSFLIVMSLHIL